MTSNSLGSVHALLQRSNAQLLIDVYVQTRVKILFEGELKMIGITDIISKSNVLKFTY